MIKLSNLIKNRAILFGMAAIINFAGTVATLYSISTTHAQSPVVIETPASSIRAQTTHTQTVRAKPEFSGHIEAVHYAEPRPEMNGRMASAITGAALRVDGGTIKSAF